MTTPIANIDNTTLLSLTPNLDIGDVADPALRLAYFQYLNVYIQTITTAFNAFVASGGVGTVNLADLSVTTGKLALLSVTAAQIASLAVGTAQLADGAVTSSKILDGTIVDADINASASIAGSKLADGGVTSAKIANDTIVDADINSGAAIAWSKISKTSSSLANLASRLITDLTGILAAAQFPALTGDVTTVAGSLATTLKNTGISGTYQSVTTDAQGRVTAGTNPTTLSGYGITDAAPLSHVGSGGASQHTVATALSEGFMSIADKTKLDGLSPTGLAGYTVPANTYITFGGRFKIGYNSTTDTLDTYET